MRSSPPATLCVLEGNLFRQERDQRHEYDQTKEKTRAGDHQVEEEPEERRAAQRRGEVQGQLSGQESEASGDQTGVGCRRGSGRRL